MEKRNDTEKLIVKLYNTVSAMKPLNAALARNPTGL